MIVYIYFEQLREKVLILDCIDVEGLRTPAVIHS